MSTQKKQIINFNLITDIIKNTDNILVQRDNGTTFRTHISDLQFLSLGNLDRDILISGDSGSHSVVFSNTESFNVGTRNINNLNNQSVLNIEPSYLNYSNNIGDIHLSSLNLRLDDTAFNLAKDDSSSGDTFTFIVNNNSSVISGKKINNDTYSLTTSNSNLLYNAIHGNNSQNMTIAPDISTISGISNITDTYGLSVGNFQLYFQNARVNGDATQLLASNSRLYWYGKENTNDASTFESASNHLHYQANNINGKSEFKISPSDVFIKANGLEVYGSTSGFYYGTNSSNNFIDSSLVNKGFVTSKFTELTPAPTLTIDANYNLRTNKKISNSSLILDIDFSNFVDGSDIVIDYRKTTASDCTLNFPSSSYINNDSLITTDTTDLVGSANSIFLIRIVNVGDGYRIDIKKYNN